MFVERHVYWYPPHSCKTIKRAKDFAIGSEITLPCTFVCVSARPANIMMRNFLVVLASLLTLASSPAYSEADHFPEITFHLHAPEARSVEVIGDFNAWLPGSTFLQGPDENGMWWTTIVIASDVRRVEYVYLVDGEERLLDPAQRVVSDDFGGRNNVWLSP